MYGILTAYLWGEVAQALGKNRWLYRVMAFLSVPLLITMPIMAFDSSQPVTREPGITHTGANEQEHNLF